MRADDRKDWLENYDRDDVLETIKIKFHMKIL